MKNLEQLEPTFYDYADGGTVKVVETEKSGEAELTIQLKYKAISFVIKSGNGFSYLKTKNTPDGIVFEENPDQGWILHIFECKKTVTEKAWKKAKLQFDGGLLHADMLRGLLDVPAFSEVKVYTVYRESKLFTQSPSPGLYRQPVGVKMTKPPYSDWKENQLTIVNGLRVSHKKIKLDQEGRGIMELG
ncbi:hypothetical protein JCM9140_4388 [Halalkalibacter wakoensis JCM 9140]|uniref:Uncharacterized protein n=1 Tax=Halalkalibacter wakoensis JCM 9140 TaxID=1236970 RepID=W4Q7X8_9BACI|nr:hypothetical protein [Halalkalibacter wakoensis]GAE28181.1 hypothetical protein JCM9140_4388 [Halalkalibacter wakoensis JCM 9140]